MSSFGTLCDGSRDKDFVGRVSRPDILHRETTRSFCDVYESMRAHMLRDVTLSDDSVRDAEIQHLLQGPFATTHMRRKVLASLARLTLDSTRKRVDGFMRVDSRA